MAHDEQDSVDGWQTYSLWLDAVRDGSSVISDYEDDESFKGKLEACKTNLERFELVWDDAKLRGEIQRIYAKDSGLCEQSQASRAVKSAEKSRQMRDQGNKSFKEGRYMQALNQYSLAVRLAPYPNPEASQEDQVSLALALANRSAALFWLKRYRLCILDIELALSYGYPAANKFKLLVRRLKCLHILAVWANDIEQLKSDLMKMLNDPQTKANVKAEIQSMFEFLEQTQSEDFEKDELDIVDETVMKISNVNKSVPKAADCVEMSYDPDKGRYLIANKDLSFGRLLIVEEPFVCVLAPSERDRYCYNCFRCLHSCGLGCTGCTQVLYCSRECQNERADLHAYECNKFLEFQDRIGVAYLVSHIMFRMKFNLNDIPICTKKTTEKKSIQDVESIKPGDWPDLVYKGDYASVFSLLDHASDYEFVDLFSLVITATYLTIAMNDKISQFRDKISDSANGHQLVCTFGSVVLKHLMQLQTNLVSILEQNVQDLAIVGGTPKNVEERPLGVGIYPTISLLNHSCTPNILSIFHQNRFVARASRSLECGTEINYCYGPSVSRMSKKDRQHALREQYFFTCNCDACSSNKENEGRAFLCLACQGPVIVNRDSTHQCLHCKAENHLKIEDCQTRLRNLSLHFSQVKNSQQLPLQKINKLKDLEDALSKLAYWRHPLFVDIKSELLECAEATEDIELALKYCNEDLDLCSKIHGPDSYEAIVAKLRLINLRWQLLYTAIEECEDETGKIKGIESLKELLAMVNETRSKFKDLIGSTNILGAEASFEPELKFLSSLHSSINTYRASLETANGREAALPQKG